MDVRPTFKFRDLGFLDGAHDPLHVAISRLSAELVSVSYAKITFLDEATGRILIRAMFGFGAEELAPLGQSYELPLCRRILDSDAPVQLDDIGEVPQKNRTPFVQALDVRSYLGVPLHDPAGHAVGTLCVMDRQPRIWSARQRGQVSDMAALADQTILLRASLATVRLLYRPASDG